MSFKLPRFFMKSDKRDFNEPEALNFNRPNAMIIKSGKERTFHFCPDRNCRCDNEDEGITTFYSEEHAIDAGWVKTNTRTFCPCDVDYVWVCPDCWKKFTESANGRIPSTQTSDRFNSNTSETS